MAGKLIKIHPNGERDEIIIERSEPSLEDLRKCFDGDVTIQHLNLRFKNIVRDVYVDEEGTWKELPINEEASKLASIHYSRPVPILGTAVVWIPGPPSEAENTVPVQNAEFNEDSHLEEQYEDPFLSDVEADADVLKSAGWGTDEDYGGGDEKL